jgi:hypothetical protein
MTLDGNTLPRTKKLGLVEWLQVLSRGLHHMTRGGERSVGCQHHGTSRMVEGATIQQLNPPHRPPEAIAIVIQSDFCIVVSIRYDKVCRLALFMEKRCNGGNLGI